MTVRTAAAAFATALMASVVLAQGAGTLGATLQGAWLPTFFHDHTGFRKLSYGTGFNAIHMCLIPAGPNRGRVLVMDRSIDPPPGETWFQRYSIVDVSNPAIPAFDNHELALPANEGDLFCCGHTWHADGRLFVAGGTTQYQDPYNGTWSGGRLALWFDPFLPAAEAWTLHQAPLLNTGRWYPTVALTDREELLVFGGMERTTNTGRVLLHDFEVFDGAQWRVHAGPPLLPGEGGNDYLLGLYPRVHLLQSGRLFFAAHSPRARRLSFPNPRWEVMDRLSHATRGGASLLFPDIPGFRGRDVVMVIGGRSGGVPGTVTDAVHYCAPDAPRAGAFPRGMELAELAGHGPPAMARERDDPPRRHRVRRRRRPQCRPTVAGPRLGARAVRDRA